MPEQKLHPQAQQVCDLIVASGRPPIETLTPAEARKAYLASRADPAARPRGGRRGAWRWQATGPAGPIPLRLYRGNGVDKGRPQPALIYFHGGGWVIGDLESHDQVCRALANAIPAHRRLRRLSAGAGAQVPGRRRGCDRRHALDRRQRRRLGIDAGRLAVGGDSAGGNLAAVVCARCPRSWRAAPRPPGPDLPRHRHAHGLAVAGAARPAAAADAGGHAVVRRPLSAQRRRQGGLARLAADGGESGEPAAGARSSPPASIRCATRARPTRRRCARPAWRWRSQRFEGQIHGFATMGRIIADAGRAVATGAAALRGIVPPGVSGAGYPLCRSNEPRQSATAAHGLCRLRSIVCRN